MKKMLLVLAFVLSQLHLSVLTSLGVFDFHFKATGVLDLLGRTQWIKIKWHIAETMLI